MRSACQAFGLSRGPVQRFLKQCNNGHGKEAPAIDNKHHGFPCTSHRICQISIIYIYISSEACHEINSWILSWAFVSRSGRPPYQFVQAMPIGESGFEQDGGCVQFFVLKMMMYQVPITSRWIKWLLYRHPDTSTSPFGILMSSFFANLWRGLHDFQLLQGS